MRLIPVIDLLDDQAVHAVKGLREHYRPVKSVVCSTSDPLELAVAFRDRMSLQEIYIADLNAIQGFSKTRHRLLIQKLCALEGISIILDAGTSRAEDAERWLDIGVRKFVVGSETLHRLEDLSNLPAQIQSNKLIFSLDLRNGRILSRCRELEVMTPEEVQRQLYMAGWEEMIILDLSRVGSSQGVDISLAASLVAKLPVFRLLIGGGIAKPEELEELNSVGVAGVLIGTALHDGTVDARHICRLQGKKGANSLNEF